MAKLILPQQQVSPQFATPDVAASGGAQAGADQNMANAMSQSSQILLDIADKNQQRYERLGRLTSSEAARKNLMIEMSRMKDEEDLSDPKSLKAFDENSKAIIENELQNHDGRQDSAIALRDELTRMRSDYSAQFFKEHHSAVIGRGKNIVNRKVGEMIELVTNTPSALGEAREEIAATIHRVIGDDLPSDQTDIMINDATTSLVSATFGSIAAMQPSRTQLEQMGALLNPEIAGSIDNEVYRQMKISWYSASAQLDKAQAEQQLGSKGKWTPAFLDQQISQNNAAYERGELSPYKMQTHEDMVNVRHGFNERINSESGAVELLRDIPVSESTRRAYRAQNREHLLDRPKEIRSDQDEKKGIEMTESSSLDPSKTLYAKALKITGPWNAARRAGEKFFLTSSRFEAEDDVKTYKAMEINNKQLIDALRKSSRFAATEVAWLEPRFDSMPSWFGSEESLASELQAIEEYVREAQSKAYEAKHDKTLHKNDRAIANRVHSAIMAYRSGLQHPDARFFEPGSQEEKDSIAREKQNEQKGGGQPSTYFHPVDPYTYDLLKQKGLVE